MKPPCELNYFCVIQQQNLRRRLMKAHDTHTGFSGMCAVVHSLLIVSPMICGGLLSPCFVLQYS